MSKQRPHRILMIFTGSIAAFKAAQILSQLQQKGFEVQCVATPAALQFIGPATLEGLTGRQVLSDTFGAGEQMQHVHLTRWADMILACPASANWLNQVAAGLGVDLATTVMLAHDFSKPLWIAPAMNHAMWQHPVTQESVKKISHWPNVTILEPNSGSLACGETGPGRLAEPEFIIKEVEKYFRFTFQEIISADTNLHPTSHLRILITAGGTQEAIDSVRVITNKSTGRTGTEIAAYFLQHRHHITLLHAQNADLTPLQQSHLRQKQNNIDYISFSDFRDFENKITKTLSDRYFHAVIHLAALSDFSVYKIHTNGESFDVDPHRKLSSANHTSSDSGPNMSIELRKNPKLIGCIKKLSRNPSVCVIGFKLTTGASLVEREAAIANLPLDQIDLVVSNDLSEISSDQHRAKIYQSLFAVPLKTDAEVKTSAKGNAFYKFSETENKSDLARELEKIIYHYQQYSQASPIIPDQNRESHRSNYDSLS